MENVNEISVSITSHLKVLSFEEQKAVLQLVKTMAQEACKRETGYSIDEYNNALELAEAEPTQGHQQVMNELNEWLSNKKNAIV